MLLAFPPGALGDEIVTDEKCLAVTELPDEIFEQVEKLDKTT
jgi:hypothetical protein